MEPEQRLPLRQVTAPPPAEHFLDVIRSESPESGLKTYLKPDARETIRNRYHDADARRILGAMLRAPYSPGIEAVFYDALKASDKTAFDEVNDQVNKDFADETGDADLRVEADSDRVRQLFRLLFERAVAAGPGEVRVRLSARPAQMEGCPAVEVVVRNSGPTPPADAAARFFEPFSSSAMASNGFGMAVARQIVEAHGGQITLAEGDEMGVVIRLPRG